MGAKRHWFGVANSYLLTKSNEHEVMSHIRQGKSYNNTTQHYNGMQVINTRQSLNCRSYELF